MLSAALLTDQILTMSLLAILSQIIYIPTPPNARLKAKYQVINQIITPTPLLRSWPGPLSLSLSHRQTPALRITPSNSSTPTPLATPAPPFASSIMSLSSSSSTSSFSTAATRRKCASVIGPPSCPLVKSRNASSRSARCAALSGSSSSSSSRAWNLRAQMAKKGS